MEKAGLLLRASIISIGNELLSGDTIDTNAAYLSKQLQLLSIPRVSGYTVSDDILEVVKALKSASDEADVIIVVGGLGPTDDDITREAISEFCNCKLVLNEEILKKIKGFFDLRGGKMPPTNEKQTYLPEGAQALPNRIGTAPGIKIEFEKTLIYAVPGVPSEAQDMFEASIKPDLERLEGRKPVSVRYLSCFGMSESQIAHLLSGRMERGRNPLVNITASGGVKTLCINSVADTREKADENAEEEQKNIAEILGNVVFSKEKETLAQATAKKLKQFHKTIAVAESCTGGLIGKLLTDIPGSSDYFKGGIIAYNNESKIEMLNVPLELINKYGAVSKEIAEAMAKGALKNFDTDCAISTTGIAGPTGATPDKSIGLVYICVVWDDKDYVERCNFPPDRETVRYLAANYALNLLRLKLLI
ncbi:MAG: competence/damage-inducible protein A [Sedimentisphaerales bacterium]|nr:competence/damage-inducible protein A [Sedimentisphaerales bacterium]